MLTLKTIFFLTFTLFLSSSAFSQSKKSNQNLVEVAKGWSQTSVNAVVFRKNSLVSDKHFQYIAFYDTASNVVIGKGPLKEKPGN